MQFTCSSVLKGNCLTLGQGQFQLSKHLLVPPLTEPNHLVEGRDQRHNILHIAGRVTRFDQTKQMFFASTALLSYLTQDI